MSSAPGGGRVGGNQRYTQANPCPICGGSDRNRRGQGTRCFGFISGDGEYARCAREGTPEIWDPKSECYAHKLKGECLCGQTHNPSDYVPPSRKPSGPPPKRKGHRTLDLAVRYILSLPSSKEVKATEAGRWTYQDAGGTDVYAVVRLETSEGKSYRPVHWEPEAGWMTFGHEGLRPLYGLPLLLSTPGTVHVVEGERCVGRARDIGLLATTSAHGAKSPDRTDWSPLAGRDVIIIPDEDEAGHRFASKVQDILRGLDNPATTRIAKLPGLADGEDIVEWLERLPDAWDDERARAEIERLAGPPVLKVFPADPPPPVPPDERGIATTYTPQRINLTDTGNSLRLVRDHGENLRYCPQWGAWLKWDGKRWKQDTNGQVYRLARKTVQGIGAEAADAGDPDERKALLKWALASESRKHIDSMIHLARFVEEIPVETHELDRDPWLLNVRNGTIDLRTGELRPHRREDLITKLCNVDYDPKATCPRWDKFEREIMDGDEAMVGYLRRIAGYGITGDVREHQLYFFYGEGRNGKSLWLGIVQRLLGDYSTTINASLITSKQNEDHPTGLTDLEGRRFVSTIEVADGKRMAEALVKSLTGGDPIRARRMRQDFYQFLPTHKLILAANHKPDIRETTEAIWERVKLIPFPVTFVEADRVNPAERLLLKDKGLESTLWAEAPGILATLVRSCLEWQREGLKEPEAVVKATAGYRAEMDRVTDFIAECCAVAPGVRVKANALYEAYKSWAKSSGENEIPKRKFGSNMERRGFTNISSNSTWWRLGIALLSENGEHFG